MYYGKEDCDETIANWAYIHKGVILSGDQDYYRYSSQCGKYNFYDKDAEKPYSVCDVYGYDRDKNEYYLETYSHSFEVA